MELPVPAKYSGENSLTADPGWWEAMLENLCTPAMSRTSEAVDSKMEWNPVMAASAAWPIFRRNKSLSAYYMYLKFCLDS